MGWGGGNRVIDALQSTLVDNVPDRDTRITIYAEMLTALEDMDWDNADECIGFDEAYDSLIYIDRFVHDFMIYTGVDEATALYVAENAYEHSEDKDWSEDAVSEAEEWKQSQ